MTILNLSECTEYEEEMWVIDSLNKYGKLFAHIDWKVFVQPN